MDIETIHTAFIKSGKTIALAESCTGGKIAATLTSFPGASAYLLGSVVAYSNEWKSKFLHVSEITLRTKGAVSEETVMEMVQGLLDTTQCDLAAAISGIAGPSGGTPEKPVGTVYIATCMRGQKIKVKLSASPRSDRQQIIDQAVLNTLSELYNLLPAGLL